MTRILLFLSLVLALLLASCQPAPQTVDDRPLTVTPTVDGGPATVTPTTTEAPLTLAELGIPDEGIQSFRGVEGHIKREVIDGEKVYTTTILYHNGEQKQAKYIIEPGTFDAHTEIHDDLTRPLAVKAYRLDENGKKTEVILFWQGPERGFREAIDLSGAYDPELNQVDKHPYVHIVHGDKPIKSIDDLPLEDERLTLFQSVRFELAKAIRAIREFRDEFINNPDATITIDDIEKYFDGSVFTKGLKQRLIDKINNGEKITKKDFYILFSAEAVDMWNAGGGLSILFSIDENGIKWAELKAKGNDQVAYAAEHTEEDYDKLNMKFFPLWFTTKDENGNIRHKMLIFILDKTDIDRYNASKDPTDLQGLAIIAENRFDVKVSPDIINYWREFYKNKAPSFPYVVLYAEGGDLEKIRNNLEKIRNNQELEEIPELQELIEKLRQQGKDEKTIKTILGELARLIYLLSLPDNQAKDFEFWSSDIHHYTQKLEEEKLIEVPLVTPGIPYQCPPDLQLLELVFRGKISISKSN